MNKNHLEISDTQERDFNDVLPIDLDEETKTEDYAHLVPTKNWRLQILLNFANTPENHEMLQQIIANLPDDIETYYEVDGEEIEEEFANNEKLNWDIDIIITDGAASCCTWDKMYSWLENL